MPDYDKFSFPNPKNWSNSSSGSLKLGQKSVLKVAFCKKKKKKKKKKIGSTSPKFGADLFYKLSLSALLATHPYPNQSWVPHQVLVKVNTWDFAFSCSSSILLLISVFVNFMIVKELCNLESLKGVSQL